MNWLIRGIVGLAVLAGVAALLLLGMQPAPEVEDLSIPEAPVRATPQATPKGERARPPQGGRYEGLVVNERDRPVDSAHVLLVAYNPGDPAAIKRYSDALSESGMPDPTLIPRIGDYRIAGEKVTDTAGVFELTAEQAAYITHIVAYRMGYFPTIEDITKYRIVKGKTRTGIKIVLQPAGKLVGRVVDHETNEPVPNAQIDINMQNPTRPPPEIQDGEEFAVRGKTGTAIPLSQFSLLQQFVSEHLGERVWGIPFTGSNGLRIQADANGNFELGPLGETVQLEFIVTHPDYKWADIDNPTGKTAPRRTMVRAGQTVEKELRLRRGLEVAGKVVVRETGEPVSRALVEVRSISAYSRHWWYRHRTRKTRTDDQGRFRVAGLANGDQNIMISHPSFGTVYKSGVSGGEKNVVVYVQSFGALVGTVSGLPARPAGGRIEVNFESTEERPKYARLQTKTVVLTKDDQFEVMKMRPGTYRVSVRAGTHTSQPMELEIRALEIEQADFALGGGGALQTSFFSQKTPTVDPVTVYLYRIKDGREQRISLLVTRQGELEVEGLVPGTYSMRARAFGYVPKRIEAFEVPEDRLTKIPPIELQAIASLAFGTILDESGRPFAANRGVVILEVTPAGGKPQRILNSAVPLSMAPGVVKVSARAEQAGLQFSRTYTLVAGQTITAKVQLSRDG